MTRLIDADKLYPDCLTKEGTLAISQSQIANAPTVEESYKDLYIDLGYEQGYERGKSERPTNGDIIMALFPNRADFNGGEGSYFLKDWWNAPYKKEADNEIHIQDHI